ncbi:MAG: hypothetical protein MJ124_08050 [Lachnospiraceae bacterium]|nr:hypothetical protein [Lachnospiraceae bacterium]
MKNNNYNTNDIDMSYFERPTRTQGNVVLKSEPRRVERRPNHIKRYVPEIDREAKIKPHVGRGVDFVSMIVLTIAIVACVYVCFNYLQIRSDIIKLEDNVASLESVLNETVRENEAFNLSLEATAPDLNHVYEVAVGQLGMVFPNNNEVIYYDMNDITYFRQYGDIPTK